MIIAWPANTCYGCHDKFDRKLAYAYAYCSEECWIHNGGAFDEDTLKSLIFDTMTRLGII